MSYGQEELKEAIAEMHKQDETMVLRILPVSELNDWIEKGNRGDMEARANVISIHDWMKQADKALDEGFFPGCGYCRDALEKGGVGGWAILIPEADGVGLVIAYCSDCIRKHSREVLTNSFIERAEAELGIGLMTEH